MESICWYITVDHPFVAIPQSFESSPGIAARLELCSRCFQLELKDIVRADFHVEYDLGEVKPVGCNSLVLPVIAVVDDTRVLSKRAVRTYAVDFYATLNNDFGMDPTEGSSD